MQKRRSTRGQSSLEMAFLFAIIILVLVAFQRYIRNAVTGRLKSSSDSVSQVQVDPHDGTTSLNVNRVTRDVQESSGRSTSSTDFDNTVRSEQLN